MDAKLNIVLTDLERAIDKCATERGNLMAAAKELLAALDKEHEGELGCDTAAAANRLQDVLTDGSGR